MVLFSNSPIAAISRVAFNGIALGLAVLLCAQIDTGAAFVLATVTIPAGCLLLAYELIRFLLTRATRLCISARGLSIDGKASHLEMSFSDIEHIEFQRYLPTAFRIRLVVVDHRPIVPLRYIHVSLLPHLQEWANAHGIPLRKARFFSMWDILSLLSWT